MNDAAHGQWYVDLHENRTPKGFYLGGVSVTGGIPDSVVMISADVYMAFQLLENQGKALSVRGDALEDPAPVVIPLGDYRKVAKRNLHRDVTQLALDRVMPEQTPRELRVWSETVDEAVAVNRMIADPVASEFQFISAYMAGPTSETTVRGASREVLDEQYRRDHNDAEIERLRCCAIADIEASLSSDAIDDALTLDLGGLI